MKSKLTIAAIPIFLIASFFGFQLYQSIQEEIKIKDSELSTIDLIKDKLIILGEAQKLYKNNNGEYATSWETLKRFLKNDDIVICVQGDEPMLNHKMITHCIGPFYKNNKIKCTVLAMDIISKDQYLDPNIVKIVHDLNDEVLYTSRSPIPFSKNFSPNLKAKRIYGIFAFRWGYLKKFTKTKESFLEKIESCDSNRICDNGRGQYIARQKYIDSFSVDCYADLKKVEKYIKKDPIFNKYNRNALK